MMKTTNQLTTLILSLIPAFRSAWVGLLFLAITFSACNREDFESPEGKPTTGGNITFNIGFSPQTRVATGADFNSTWETGDEIGIFAVKRATSNTTATLKATNYIHNVKLTYNGTDWKTDAGVSLYYPNDGEVLDFYAYYPYQASVNPTAFTFTVKTDQSGTAYNQSDLLSAKEIGVAKSTGDVSLQFKHELSLVQVKLGKEVNVPHFDNTLRVTLKNVQGTAIFNNTSPAGATTDIVMHKVAGMDNTYRALVPAQTIAAGKQLFSFVQTTTGEAFSFEYAPAAATELTAGKAKQHSITLGWGIDPDHVYAIGDPYPHKGQVIGLVYEIETGGKHGKIVSLDEGQGRWGDPNVNEMNAGVTGIQDVNDGKTATKNLIEKRKNDPNFTTDYYAFNWIYQTKNKGDASGIWYLPAKDELKALSDVYTYDKTAFNKKLDDAGGAKLSDSSYRSSSEIDNLSAWIVNFSGGPTNFRFKDLDYRVRGVSAF